MCKTHILVSAGRSSVHYISHLGLAGPVGVSLHRLGTKAGKVLFKKRDMEVTAENTQG